MRIRTIAAISALLVMSLAAVTSAGAAGGRPFTTHLAGPNEVPIAGDPDASGTARLWINAGQGTVCWSITVSNVDTIVAAPIHAAPAGTPGGIVVPLNPYTGGCTTVDRTLAVAILTNPSGDYVNVHHATYPCGAARGQLSHTP